MISKSILFLGKDDDDDAIAEGVVLPDVVAVLPGVVAPAQERGGGEAEAPDPAPDQQALGERADSNKKIFQTIKRKYFNDC